MGRVTGIGGLFFRSQYPKALGAWYEKYFGINAMGSNEVWKQEAGATVFAPFEADTKYFGESQQFMINFRVEGLDEVLEILKADGVRIDEKQEMEYGKLPGFMTRKAIRLSFGSLFLIISNKTIL